MSQPIWRPPRIEYHNDTTTRPYQALSHKHKIWIWLVALALSWLMGLGVLKFGLILYDLLG